MLGECILHVSAAEDRTISCARFVSARRNTRSLLVVNPTRWRRPLALVGPPQRMPLVYVQDGADCTVGEVEEGSTLIGFPGDDVCVAAT